MKVYRIGITGHRPDGFKDPIKAKKLCEDTTLKMYSFYPDPIFNLGGCIGADQWVGTKCIDLDIRYNLFLPFPPEIQSKHWYEAQKKELKRQVEKCNGLIIAGPKYKPANFFIRNRQIVDNSDIVICFWEGNKRGGTYDCVKYAVKKSKITLNALDNLSMIDKSNL